MANRIKGITVEIGGDTTKLDKALQGVNKELKQTQSELKDVDRLLKLDPKNVTLLAQKQDLLQKSIAGTGDKLKTLKEAANQANDALAKGEISKSQYDALQREIIATEQDLKKLEAQAKETSRAMSGITQTGEKLKGIGDKMSSVGAGMAKYVTAPIVGIGAAAVLAFNEVDAGLDTVATKTGATGAQLEELQSSMKKVYGGMAVTAEDAGIAIGEVNTRFGVTGETLEDVSSEFLKFAEINGTDLNNSIDKVDSLMKKYGVDISQTSQVLGVMTKAGQSSGIAFDTLAGAMETNGASLKEMGFNLASSVNLLAQMEASGVDTSTAMMGLKKAVQNATKQGLSADDALKSTISSIKNAKTQTEALQIATRLFGTKGAAEMTQAIRENRLSIDDLSKSMTEYEDVVNTTYENTLDGPDKAKIAMNNLKLAGTELATSFFNVVAPALQNLVSLSQGLVTWFSGLSDGTKNLIVTIGILIGVVGPVILILGKIISAVGTIMTILPGVISVLGAVKGAVLAVNAALLANPIALVIAAVVALIAIFVTLWNKCEWFRNFWINLWNGIKNVVVAVWDGIKSVVGGIVDTIIGGISKAVDWIKALPAQALQWGKDMIMGFVNGIKSAIGWVADAAKGVAGKIKSLLHFSVPDEGPLTDYESWMPDFMRGLADGINKSKYLVANAVKGVAADMVINPNVQTDAAGSVTRGGSGGGDMMQGSTVAGGGDNIQIPVYIGGQLLDEIVVNSKKNVTLRSGGFANV